MPQNTPSGQPTPMQPGEFGSASQASRVTFKTQHVDPPSSLYVRPEEFLLINVISISGLAHTLRVSYKLLLPEGSVQIGSNDFPLTANATLQQFAIPLTEAFLLQMNAVVVDPHVTRGQVFVSIQVARGNLNANFPVATLLQDYATSQFNNAWPGGPLRSSTDGPGWSQTINLGLVTAGHDMGYTSPANTRTLVRSMAGSFITAVTVATRIVRVQAVSSAGRIFWQSPPSATQAASLTVQYAMTAGQNTLTTDPATINVSLPSPLVLNGNDQINTNTTALQAADQWSNTSVNVEQWVELQ